MPRSLSNLLPRSSGIVRQKKHALAQIAAVLDGVVCAIDDLGAVVDGSVQIKQHCFGVLEHRRAP